MHFRRATAPLVEPSDQRIDRHIESLALGSAIVHGRFNDDELEDIAVSAPQQNAAGTEAGAVYVHFGTDRQRALTVIDSEEARAYLAAGEFPAGSMGPKVESALQFLEAGGRRAVITSLAKLPEALKGTAGTSIVAASAPTVPAQSEHTTTR